MARSTPRGPAEYVLSTVMLLGTCMTGEGAPAANPIKVFPAAMTIQDLMETRIDPSADGLWDSVAFIASDKGEEDRRPRTASEWAAVREKARTLIEAAVDLRYSGRQVAALPKAPGPGELETVEIQRRIDSNRSAFAKRARLLESAAREALAAIGAKDPDALVNAGGSIDAACEACHVAYWYPNQLTQGH